jgi:lysophospholipase L1-like esterase
MKKTFTLIALVTAITFCSFIPFQKKTKVVFFGDSITQQGAGKGGYILKMDSLMQQKGISNYELVGAGVSGNRVYDLYLRMEADVLEKNPDVVVIYIGINDVWHKTTSGTGTEPAKFERFYRAIIKKLQDKNIKVIVCTPSVIGERNDNTNLQDGDLNLYSNLIKNMANDLKLPVIDLRKGFMEYLQTNNPKNEELVAQTMWKVIYESTK